MAGMDVFLVMKRLLIPNREAVTLAAFLAAPKDRYQTAAAPQRPKHRGGLLRWAVAGLRSADKKGRGCEINPVWNQESGVVRHEGIDVIRAGRIAKGTRQVAAYRASYNGLSSPILSTRCLAGKSPLNRCGLQRFIVAHTLHERVTSATPASVVFFQDMFFNKVRSYAVG